MFVDETLVDKYNLCYAESTDGWAPHVVDLSAYAGQSVDLAIGAETDDSFFSSLFVDDVSFQSGPASDVPLGGEVLYNIVVENRGGGPASGLVLTDVLPSGVLFDTGIVTDQVVFPAPNTLAWGPGDMPANFTYTVRFTAVVTDSQAFTGQSVTNTVDYASTNAGSGSSQAVFAIARQPTYHYVYLPLVVK